MPQAIIVGIHGLLNKPPQEVLDDWWAKAIAEGLHRNHGGQSLPVPFEFAYWADIQYLSPIPVVDVEDRYELAPGQGPLRRYTPGLLDKARAVAQKWGGRVLDKEKDLIGLGTNVEMLLGMKFSDLADYYDQEGKRQQMRSRLSDLLERHQGKEIFLIAHSMGSIIGYDVLRTLDHAGTLKGVYVVTIGSPLGLPIVTSHIRREFGGTQTPQNVRQWTNIADPGDKVALDCNLADEYTANATGVQVHDVLTHNDYVNQGRKANKHNSFGYLRAPELSDLVHDFCISRA